MDIKIKARIYALIVTIIIVFGVVLLVNGYIKFKKNRFDSNQTKMYRDIDCIIIGTKLELILINSLDLLLSIDS